LRLPVAKVVCVSIQHAELKALKENKGIKGMRVREMDKIFIFGFEKNYKNFYMDITSASLFFIYTLK
jgi:hypothetical protein